MEHIPIKFEYEGKQYAGKFVAVSGSGKNHFHLMIDNFYKGQLVYGEYHGWQFHEGFKGMAEYFGDYIVAWYC